jgi:hypothetical protein
MDRKSLAFKHFLLSVFIFSIVTFILSSLWYPAPYFLAAGGWQGLQIAAPIDLVLGPLLTLVVVNKHKTKSKIIFDLVVIGLIQLSALTWGVSTIYQQRPVANVYWDWEKAFFSVSAADLNKYGYELSKLDNFDSKKPVLIVARKPVSKQEIDEVVSTISQKAIPPYLQTNLYEPLALNFIEVKLAQLDLATFLKSENEAKKISNKLLNELGGDISDYVIIPLFAKYQDLGIVFSQTGEYKTTIFLRDK